MNIRGFCFRRLFVCIFLCLLFPFFAPAARGAAGLVISEFLAKNENSLADEDGERHGYIEIYNGGIQPVELEGWYLTDDLLDLAKWQFPPVTVLPGRYLVVFASAKDRSWGAPQLHTNFKLAEADGYLALIEPDAITVRSSFGPGYPAQLSDISYGYDMGQVSSSLISEGTEGRFMVPENGLLGNAWISPDFDDANWQRATNAIGYDAKPNPIPRVVADSVADFSGVQGNKGWSYGYYDRTADIAENLYRPAKFVPYSDFNGQRWGWSGNPAPLDHLTAMGGFPNGLNSLAVALPNSTEHWPVRRWKATHGGSFRLHFRLAKTTCATGSGDGLTGMIFHNGNLVFTRTIAAGMAVGFYDSIDFPSLQKEDLIDFVISPVGVGQPVGNDTCDNAIFTARFESMPAIQGNFLTDVQPMMKDRNASIYYRLPFTVEDPSQSADYLLRMKYDDGFAMYLNGSLIWTRKAPMIATGGQVANSAPEFSSIQGHLNWFYGYYHRSADPDFVYQPWDFIIFPHDKNEPYGPKNYWRGTKWDMFPDANPWTELYADGGHPNGSINTAAYPYHQSIRRWKSEVSGTVTITTRIRKYNTQCGNGMSFFAYHNGKVVWHATIPIDQTAILTNTFQVTNVDIGDDFDFALDPVGTDGALQDSCDSALYTATIVHTASSDSLTWNSSAIGATSNEEGLSGKTLDPEKFVELLLPGRNVLAIQGLNVSASDDDFLLHPSLSQTRTLISAEATHLVPTPGGINALADLQEFRILSILRTETHMEITWQSSEGKQYRVEYKDSLGDSEWTELYTLYAEGENTTVADPLSTQQRYYRVVEL